jgi:hypothetical protein
LVDAEGLRKRSAAGCAQGFAFYSTSVETSIKIAVSFKIRERENQMISFHPPDKLLLTVPLGARAL